MSVIPRRAGRGYGFTAAAFWCLTLTGVSLRQAYELTGVVGLRSAAARHQTLSLTVIQKVLSDTASNAAAIGIPQAAVRGYPWRVITLRVSRSLTIAQMAMVAAVVMVFACLFAPLFCCSIWHSRTATNDGRQLEKYRAIRSGNLFFRDLKAILPGAETWKVLQPAGVVSRADVVLPNQFRVA